MAATHFSTFSPGARPPPPSAAKRSSQKHGSRIRCRSSIPDLPHGGPPELTASLESLWLPNNDIQAARRPRPSHGAPGAMVAPPGRRRSRGPPPDLPSLMLHSRIVFLGMAMVPAVTELVLAELMYLQYRDAEEPIYMYINSSGTTMPDGTIVGFETEGTAIYDAMCFVRNEVYTVCVGMAYGQACMLLAAGARGKRFMLEHSRACLHQPRVPSTGSRQAIDLSIKWQEVLAQKENVLRILSFHTGHSPSKLDKDMKQRLYMSPQDAIQYGVCDRTLLMGAKQRRSRAASGKETDKQDKGPGENEQS